MNMKTIITVTAIAATMALAGCSSHHAHSHHEPASFKAYMKANDASLNTPDNMMVITPIKLPGRHK
ncbi:hypothetical protein [Acidithiobacillus thiooxidans]|uniref:Lipoprotein n=1 Tax=Acidithiobacillus thiooxidans TaxID=930 RepID=A0A1C2J867_ACITH|nr:hypothetical protein [Acidithiobacillus thiooxidans]OCX70911.1 hypothetical protein A6M23_13220 [Acidithiobacillus thiooxidans]OCX84431.1 hypothetical protein A6P08_09070 [Acidithiobacillus thiooxidans]